MKQNIQATPSNKKNVTIINEMSPFQDENVTDVAKESLGTVLSERGLIENRPF